MGRPRTEKEITLEQLLPKLEDHFLKADKEQYKGFLAINNDTPFKLDKCRVTVLRRVMKVIYLYQEEMFTRTFTKSNDYNYFGQMYLEIYK